MSEFTFDVDRVVEAFEEELAAHGLTQAAVPFIHYTRTSDALLHEGFAVGAPDSTYETFDGRANVGDFGEAKTRVVVRTSYRLTEDDGPEDYKAALRFEARVRNICIGVDVGDQNFNVIPVNTPRRRQAISGEGFADDYLHIEIHFDVHHRVSFAFGV